LQTGVMNYAGNGMVISVPPLTPQPPLPLRGEGEKAACACACPCNGAAKKPEAPASQETNGTVDFTKMTAAEKMAYHKARWDRILG
jgi:hypothetical protein